jgi:hypothetical protein
LGVIIENDILFLELFHEQKQKLLLLFSIILSSTISMWVKDFCQYNIELYNIGIFDFMKRMGMKKM